METLSLRLLGAPQVRLNDDPVTDFISSKVQGLLFYLVVTRRTATRAALATLLWGDISDSAARTNLRKALSNLRHLVGDHLAIERQTVVFRADSEHWLDVAEFERKVDDAASRRTDSTHLQEAVELYRGDFLEGFFVANAPDFEEWTRAERARLRTLMLDALMQGSRLGDPAPAMAYTRRLLRMDPAHEAAHRQLMQLLVRSGQRSAALAQYDLCCQALRQELDVKPAAETTALYERIRDGHALRAAGDSTTSIRDATTPLPATKHNVPTPPMPLVGRQREMAAVTARLLHEDVRLVTLSGPAGVGKTRLGLQVAATLHDKFEHGAYFVALAPVQTPDRVMVAVADALGIREQATNRPLTDHVREYLRTRHGLLVMDNFEHITEAASEVGVLLAACPRLHILITSRERLHLRGEYEYPVPPLALPETENLSNTTDLERLRQIESIQFLVQCGQTVRPDFVLTSENCTAVVEICLRLDGLPLALELAAARLKVLSPQAILQRLDRRFDLLRGGARDAAPRHQTLHNAIGWSYDLLEAGEKAFLRRLAVCMGGCTLEAAAAIHSAVDGSETTFKGLDALDIMSSLVDKSLVQSMEPLSNEPRFTLLETIRAFAQEQLREAGEEAAARHAHLAHYLALAERAEPELRGADQAIWLDRLDVEHDNLRAALHWTLERNETNRGPRLGIALWHFWYIRSHHVEGRQWLTELLPLCQKNAHRATILYGTGMLSRRGGDTDEAAACLEQSLTLFRQLEDTRGMASALRVLGFIRYLRGEYDAARSLLQECLALFRELDDHEGIAVSLTNLGYIAQAESDYAAARTHGEESLAMRRRSGNIHGIATSLAFLGYVAIRQVDHQAGRAYLEESLRLHRELGNRNGTTTSLAGLGDIAYAEQDYVTAEKFFAEALALGEASDDKAIMAEASLKMGCVALQRSDSAAARPLLIRALNLHRERSSMDGTIQTLEQIACLAAIEQDPAHALTLYAATNRLRSERKYGGRLPAIQDELVSSRQAAQRALSTSAVKAARARGEAMTLEETIAYALAAGR